MFVLGQSALLKSLLVTNLCVTRFHVDDNFMQHVIALEKIFSIRQEKVTLRTLLNICLLIESRKFCPKEEKSR